MDDSVNSQFSESIKFFGVVADGGVENSREAKRRCRNHEEEAGERNLDEKNRGVANKNEFKNRIGASTPRRTPCTMHHLYTIPKICQTPSFPKDIQTTHKSPLQHVCMHACMPPTSLKYGASSRSRVRVRGAHVRGVSCSAWHPAWK